MRSQGQLRGATKAVRRFGWVVALAGAVAIGVPLVASASPQATSAAAGGAAYGGVTPQGWPVVIELNRTRKQVVKATIGLTLNCTSGGLVNLPDEYSKLKISKKGKFGASFGPATSNNPDGTTTVFEGSMSGKLNRAKTKLSGKWQLKLTDHAATGAVTDTCDSGSVSWRVKQ
jgi:hypothetical protein